MSHCRRYPDAMEPVQDVSAARLPPLHAVLSLQAALTGDGIESVVGGSGLLASLGLVEEVNDWDVVVDAPPETVEDLLDRLGLSHRRRARSGLFRTAAALLVDAGDHSIDVLVGFALDSPEGVMAIPARPGGRWKGLQMARAEDWAQAYALMGRAEQAGLLERHLDDSWSPRQDSNLRHPL
ncbi:hypothetical protein GCM10009672_06580 [Nesterenkonia lutea]